MLYNIFGALVGIRVLVTFNQGSPPVEGVVKLDHNLVWVVDDEFNHLIIVEDGDLVESIKEVTDAPRNSLGFILIKSRCEECNGTHVELAW